MVQFLFSCVLSALMVAGILRVAKKRAPGTPLTWGEAFAAGVYVFGLMLLMYGIVPHFWLTWADNGLGWRSDLRGIPVGPFRSFATTLLILGGAYVLLVVPPLLQKKIDIKKAGGAAGAIVFILLLHFIFAKHLIHNNRLFSGPHDVSFLAFVAKNRGKVVINADKLRDVIAVLIYGVALTGNFAMWLWWQKRKPAAEKAVVPAVEKESSFGRPVTQGA